MKNHLPFDQHFKAELHDAESFVPKDLFEKIMAERDSKRGFMTHFQPHWFKYGIAASALIAGIGITYLKTVSKVATVPPTIVAQNEVSKESVANHHHSNNSLILNSLDKSTNSKQVSAIAPNVAKKRISVATPAANVEPKQVLIATSKVEQKQVSMLPSKVEQTDIRVNPADNVVSNPMLIHSNQDNIVDSKEAQPRLNVASPQQIESVLADELQTETPQKSIEIGIVNPEKVKKRTSLSVAPIAHLKKQHSVESYSLRSTPKMNLGPELGCPSFSLRKPNRWYIDIWGSPDYAFRKFYTNQNKGENTSYANARDSVEQTWYAFSAGARASLVMETGVALRAGLNYLQNNEIFDYKKPGQVRTVTVTESVKKPDGTTHTETRTEKHYGTYEIKKYNRYRSIDLPIQLGYEFGNMPWSFSVNGGVNFNLTSWRKAEILNPTLQPFDASPNNANVFKSNVGASLYGSFAAYYDWKDYTQLFVEPYIRHFLSPITTNDYLLEQRYTDVGLKMGIRWRL